MSPIRVIFGMTLREASRRRILSMGVLIGLAMLLLFGVALYFISRETPPNAIIAKELSKMFLVIGMYPFNMLVAMVAVFGSADTLAGEIRSGVVQTMASKPIHRGQIVLGKWLAYAALLGGYLLLLTGGQTAVVYALRGFYPPRFPAAFGFMWLEALLLLSVTMWASSRLSTLAAGVVAIGLHGLAFLGGWIEEIGHVAGNNSAEMVGVVASVVFPSEALWRRAAYELQQPIVVSVIGTPFGARVVPSDWMAVYAALYAAFALAMAVRSFSRRDL
ncbi:MAG: ABC transporter permease subunit [Bryobacterales bacterium]